MSEQEASTWGLQSLERPIGHAYDLVVSLCMTDIYPIDDVVYVRLRDPIETFLIAAVVGGEAIHPSLAYHVRRPYLDNPHIRSAFHRGVCSLFGFHHDGSNCAVPPA